MEIERNYLWTLVLKFCYYIVEESGKILTCFKRKRKLWVERQISGASYIKRSKRLSAVKISCAVTIGTVLLDKFSNSFLTQVESEHQIWKVRKLWNLVKIFKYFCSFKKLKIFHLKFVFL